LILEIHIDSHELAEGSSSVVYLRGALSESLGKYLEEKLDGSHLVFQVNLSLESK
jgi:hypothetical protein